MQILHCRLLLPNQPAVPLLSTRTGSEPQFSALTTLSPSPSDGRDTQARYPQVDTESHAIPLPLPPGLDVASAVCCEKGHALKPCASLPPFLSSRLLRPHFSLPESLNPFSAFVRLVCFPRCS